jgi:hypothetical protein
MKIEIGEDYNFVLKEVFSGVLLVSAEKEEFGICMRDTGFEFFYAGEKYEAKEGKLFKINKKNDSRSLSWRPQTGKAKL